MAADLHHFNVVQDPGPHQPVQSNPNQNQSDEDPQHSNRIKIQAAVYFMILALFRRMSFDKNCGFLILNRMFHLNNTIIFRDKDMNLLACTFSRDESCLASCRNGGEKV
jgi:hypothetical protein